jgi:hypothetical protein
VSVHASGDGTAELREPSIARALKGDSRPEASPAACVAVVQAWLTETGTESVMSTERRRVAIEAAARLLEALDVRPVRRHDRI